MAEIEYGYHDEPTIDPSPGAAAALINWVGAIMSIALVIGLAVWGYKLTMRDVGEVPVVRSLAGPMREAPEDPGGVDAAHQGLAVNSVQADGGVDGPVDQITLAPAPVELTEADKPLAELRPPSREDALAQGVTIPEALRIAEAERLEAEHPDPGPLALSAIEESIAPAALPDVADDGDGAVVTEAVATADVPPEAVPASLPGVARSPRPQPRPEVDLAALQNTANASAATAAGVAELDPADIPSGTRLVQLGAFDDEPTARAEWTRIATAHGDLLDGKKRVLQKAESGGRSFYRLRVAGFEGLDDSRRFCSALLARNAACIPVTAR